MSMSIFDKHSTSIPHTDRIDVSSNEINISETFNNNFEKLYENDLTIASALSSFREGISRIERYSPRKTYNTGDIVFYVLYGVVDKSTGMLIDNSELEEVPVENIYLLRSLGDNNNVDPREGFKIIDGIATFENNGVMWHNDNPVGSIFYNEGEDKFTLSDFFEINLSNYFDDHEKDISVHKFGELQDFSELSTKILLKSFANLKEDRQRIFYPDEISSCAHYPSDERIIKSLVYKKWSKGILEYDITFQLGDQDVIMEEHAIPAGDGSTTYEIDRTHTCMAANFPENKISSILETQPQFYEINGKTVLNPNWNQNDRYFLRPEDRSIFEYETNERIQYDIKTGNRVVPQTNLTNKVNVFSGTIKFPIHFKDLNYMIFETGTAADEFVPQSFNKMVYINKTPSAVTALYILASYEVDAPIRDAALKNNRFTIHIVGRWK